jgi:hypothetical protein
MTTSRRGGIDPPLADDQRSKRKGHRMHTDLTDLRPIDLYEDAVANRVLDALGDLLSTQESDPQRKAIAIAEAAGALADRARRLSVAQVSAARQDLRNAHRLFQWAIQAGSPSDAASVIAESSAREFAQLTGSLYHREIALALEQAAAALLALTARDGFTCVHQHGAVTAQASALQRAVAQHEFVGGVLARRNPGRRTAALAPPSTRAPGASAAGTLTEGDIVSITTPRSPSEKARLTRQRKRAVALVEHEHLTIAQAAGKMNVSVEYAGALIRLEAQEREQVEYESALRARVHADWSRMAGDEDGRRPREDYLRDYTDNELAEIETLARIPNRILRDLIEEHIAEVDPTLTLPILARRLGLRSASSLKRTLGYRKGSVNRKRGRCYGGRVQRTVSIQQAGEIVRALGIPPAEVPGL